MKNNRSGFTLVELLATVVILSLLITIAIPAVLSFTTKMKKDMFCNKVATVIKSAELYGQDNMQSIAGGKIGVGADGQDDICKINTDTLISVRSNVNACVKVQLSVLLAKGYLTKEAPKKKAGDTVDPKPTDFFDPRDGSSMKSNDVYVYIINKRIYAAYVFSNKEDAEFCEGEFYVSEGKVLAV